MGFLVLVFHVFVWTRLDAGATRDQMRCDRHAATGTILQAPTKAVTPWQEFTTPEGKAHDQLRCVMCFIVFLAAYALPPCHCHCPFLPALLLQQRYQRNQMGEAGGAAAPKTVAVPIDACRYRRCKVLCRTKDHFDSFCPVCPNHCKFGALKIAPAR